MNENAKPGAVLPGGAVDLERIKAIAKAKAATKAGGARFQPAKLKDLVRAEVRSLLSLGSKDKVPADVNAALCEVCDGLADAWLAEQRADGYVMERVSGARVTIKSRTDDDTGETHYTVGRQKTATLGKRLSLKHQIDDARVKLAAINEELRKMDDGQAANGNPMTDKQHENAPARRERLERDKDKWTCAIAQCEAAIEAHKEAVK